MLRKSLKITMMALGVVAGGLLTSCSMDNEPSTVNSGNMLAKAPVMKAYSGKHVWGTTETRGANVNGNQWYNTWDCPENVWVKHTETDNVLTQEDLVEIKKLLSPGKETHNEIVLPWANYWVQQVYTGEDTYPGMNKQDPPAQVGGEILGSEHMNKLIAWNPRTETIYGDPANNYQPYEGTVYYEHVNNFNSGKNNTEFTEDWNGTHGNAKIIGTTLMTGMPTTGIEPDKQFGFHETWGTEHDYNNYLIVEYKGYYYVGFDYEAHKYDQNTNNEGEAYNIERDWNFTDWIVRISPAYPVGTTPEGNPGGVTNPEKPEIPGGGDVVIPDNPIVPFPGFYGTCIECGHDHMMGVECEECLQDDDHVCVGPEEKPGFVKGEDEVEINLAVDKKNHDLLESHLSIHVRSVTNVEVFIPVPAEYYCAADDMDIVLNHGNFVHGGPYQTKYEIGENIVTLNVAFEEDGIRIWTDGITEEVINYCRENYQDGITFEVWNYFNNPETGLPYLNMDELKVYLDQATVKFLDKEPGAYINAFGKDNGKYGSENPDGKDFHVVPEEQRSSFDDPYEGPHYNGSDNNEIYKNNK